MPALRTLAVGHILLLALVLLLSHAAGVVADAGRTDEPSPEPIPIPKPQEWAAGEEEECVLFAPQSSNVTRKTIDDLKKWMLENGAYISEKLEWPKEFSSSNARDPRKHLGVGLKQPLTSDDDGQELASIPRKLVLEAGPEVKAKYGAVVDRLVNTFPYLIDEDNVTISRLRRKDILLTLALLEEKAKKQDSFYAPFIATFQSLQEVNFVEKYTADQLEIFQDPNVAKYNQYYKNRVKAIFEELRKAGLIDTTLLLSEFQWAYYNVRKRATPWFPENANYADIKHSRELETVALIPFFDMFAFADSISYNMVWSLRENGSYVTSEGSADAGEEALVYHPPFSNFFLLMNHGYVSEENNAEGYPIGLRPFIGDDELRIAKESKWNATIKAHVKYGVVLDTNTPPELLLSFFRLLVIPNVELVESTPLDQPSSPGVEDIVLAACSRLIGDELKNQKSTLEADEAEYNSDNDEPWSELRALGLQYRIARKRILNANKCYCERLRKEHSELIPIDESNKVIDDYINVYKKKGEIVFDECFLK